MKGISPNYGHLGVFSAFGFIDVMIGFWGQKSKVKVAAGNDPKTEWISINQSITVFVPHDITAPLQQADFGTGQTGHEVHLQLPRQ